jgi:hypothetical protein
MLLCRILNCQSFVEGARQQDLALLEKVTGVPRGTIAQALGSVCSLVSLDARCDGSDEPLGSGH